jgi:hypothetical protein
MIYTIGDSHSKFAWEKINGVKCYHIGPKLMYSFCPENYKIQNVKDTDCVVFCFGEIDIRCHVCKHTKDNNEEIIMTNLCDNYIKTVNTIREKKSIKNVFIYNVIPTRRIDSVEYYDVSKIKKYIPYDEKDAMPFPFIGSDEQRKSNCLFMNQLLKELSKENFFGFIDIYDKYIDEDGFLDMRLSDGSVHIDDETYLKQYIDNYLKQFL